jgi:putative ABC transport system permease protein
MEKLKLLLKISLLSLRRNPLRRTAAVMLTVAMGTGSLYLFHGFNNGVMNQYREHTIRARFGNGQINTQGYREQIFEKPWEHWIEDPTPILGKLRSVEGVKQLFPRIEFPALLTNGAINVSGRGQGVVASEESQFFTTLSADEGEILNTQESGIFLGKGLARALGAKPGTNVTLLANTVDGSFNGMEFQVVGIFHTGQKEYDDSAFRVQLPKAQELLATSKVESITVGLHRVEDWKNVATAVAQDFPELEATPFEILDKYFYQNAVDWLDAQFNVIQSIILFIVILGIFNTVSTAVLERKQEVGNLRANGDSKGEILSLLCAESLALGVVGALAGILFTQLLTLTVLRDGILMPTSPGFTRQFYVKIDLNALMALKVFLMGSVSAVLGTFIAAWRVVRMPIAEALRSS